MTVRQQQATDDNSIEKEVTGLELPETDGTGLGEPPPGHGFEAFTDEALDAEEGDDPQATGTEPEVQAPKGDAAATAKPEAQPQATGTTEEEQQDAGIEHDPRFKNLRRLQTQQAEELKLVRERAEQMQAALQQVAPLLQGQQAPGEAEFDPFDPNSVARYIEEQVAAKTAEQAQTFTREATVTQMRQEIDSAVSAFRQANPDVAEGSELDQRVAAVMLDIQTPSDSDRPDINLYPVTVENLGIAKQLALEPDLYQAVTDLDLLPDEETVQIARDAMANPALYEELKAQPELLDSPEGIKVAYRRANVSQQVQNLPGQIQAAAAAGVRQAVPQRMRQQAHVETGGTGAPASAAPGAKPVDEFDEAVEDWTATRGASIFG